MAIITKAKKFLLLDTKSKLLFLEAFYYLGIARILIIIPFSKVSPLLGIQMAETPFNLIQSNKSIVTNIYHVIEVTSHHTFWESKCLVRAIAAMKMLERRQIASTLYLGIAKDEDGKMIAHAWLRSGSFYVTGADVMEGFTVVGKFSKIFERKA